MKEFSFLFHTRQLSREAKTFKNPFTGEPATIFLPEPFSDSEQADVEAFLKQHKYEGPEPEGEGYLRRLSGKESIRIRGMDMASGVSTGNLAVEVIAAEMSQPLLKHFYELMESAKLAVMSTTGDNVLVPAESLDELTRQHWPDAVCIKTEEEFLASIGRVWSEREVSS